ncbi:zf-HC2 domain-containing protein [Marinobacter nauticus]|uniref:Zinc finger protein n=1 Tax=Marinobacter nauticus TaxID=2743 RepID=A0A368USG8_MARNT|nr:zf-HC2 domain-containing protein [Marinobacter nauticus]RBP69402.1 putative zinc finger protein [Marinobacter nauticus]RCW30970.1 putative zinc finger protein [Marinobacter nauticus]
MTMSCPSIRSQLPDYVRATLSENEAAVVREHLQRCPRCRRRCDREEVLMSRMVAQFDVPPPAPDFESRVFGELSSGSGRRVHMAWGGAVAAALALGLFIGQSGLWQPDEAVAVAEVVDTPVVAPVERTVRLAFTAGEPLDDVTLTLNLPPHVEIAGLPGQHQVRWQVSLEQGDNVLALPLRIMFPGDGELVAELDAEGRQKVFRATIPDYPGASRHAPVDVKEPAT